MHLPLTIEAQNCTETGLAKILWDTICQLKFVADKEAALLALVAGVKAACVAGAISAGTNATVTVVKSVRSGDDFSTVIKKHPIPAVDGFADGFMIGGITAGAGMAIGVLGKTSSGIQIGKTAKPQYGKVNAGYGTPKTNGSTLLSIQNNLGKRIFSLDFDAVHAVHMHLPKLLSGIHIPIGSIISGAYAGGQQW